MELENYNKQLNKIYSNPYDNPFQTQLGNRNQNRMRKSQLPISSIRSESYIQQVEYHERNSLQNGQNSFRVAHFGLRAAQILGKQQYSTSDMSVKQKNGPTINYFVTQFQRLQSQNKILLEKLSVKNGTIKDAKMQQKSQNENQLRLQNQQLKKQLEQQKRKGMHKNEQITHLLEKITQIQSHIQVITKSKLAETGKSQKWQLQQKQKERVRQQQIEQQKQKQLMILKNQYNNMVNAKLNPLLQRIAHLEQMLNEAASKYQQLQAKATA